MNSFFKRLTLLIVAIGVIALSFWPTESQEKQERQQQVYNADYYFKQVTISKYAANGQLNSQLTASQMQHIKLTDSSEISSPEIVFVPQKTINSNKQENHSTNNKSGNYWHIQANKGLLNHKANEVLLTDDIAIQQKKTAQDQALLKVTTKALNVQLDLKQATSPHQVFIDSNFAKTSGSGLFADFNIQEVKILSQVHTQGIIHE